MGRNDSLTTEEQLADVIEGIEEATEILSAEDPESREGRAHEELERTAAVARQIETRADPRLVTLREVFTRDDYEVGISTMPGSDYELTISGGHFPASRKRALDLLGVTCESTHTHVHDDGDRVELKVYLTDGGA